MYEQNMVHSATVTYSTAGRHRREDGPGRIALTVRRPGHEDPAETPQVWINGFPIRVRYGQTVLSAPAGPMRLEVWCPWLRHTSTAELDFVLGEGHAVDVQYTAPRLGMGSGRLQVVSVVTID